MATTPWLETAKKFIGTKEIAGPKNNPTIMKWALKMGGWISKVYNNDDIPWCGLFVGNCLSDSGIALPKNPLSALAYADWGVPLSKPTPGAIMVFKRKGGGHVGFYLSEDKNNYHILGGNQNNVVSIVTRPKTPIEAIRWPKEVPVPKTGPVIAKFNGPASGSEA